MKLVKLFLCLMIMTLFNQTYQMNKYSAMSENNMLFNMWRKVPGASTEKPGDSAASLGSALTPPAAQAYNPGFSNVIAEGWLTIASPIFKDSSKFPIFKHPDGTSDILTSDDYTRINEKYKDLPRDSTTPAPAVVTIDPNSNTPPGRSFFYFRLNQKFIYYTEDKTTPNVLGNINFVDNIEPSSVHFADPLCFNLNEKSGNNWRICAANNEDAKMFLCKIQTIMKVESDDYCQGKKPDEVIIAPTPKPGQIVEKIINQPFILIPLAREMCNENWNYAKSGKDWKCLCKEGLEQSPINLPPPEKAIGSPVKALFQFDKVSNVAEEDFEDKVKAGDNLKLQYYQGALRIYSSYFGKTVTMDGEVFYAQEISFHTPSEHTINGEQFPMEMQIKHVGKSIGDTAKHLILSFVFKKSPGVYNKFLETLDFFNLPNPLDKVRELEKSIFLPNIFFQVNEDEPTSMNPFSFYTYSGSITTPPCNEKTIHYVASDPIGVSNTVLELFKEALRVPDLQDANGNITESTDNIMQSNRTTQKLNGRPVFFYDHKKYNCPTFKRLRRSAYDPGQSTGGHYERRSTTAASYFFVEGTQPSGLPGAFVVTEKEALGHQ